LFTAFASLGQERSIVSKHSRNFTRYDGCEFVPTKYADGDSFLVKIGQEEFVLRLYYVDAPESDERFPERNAEQAHYFGITPQESVEAGKVAKEFVSAALTGKKFVVFTRWATALGSSKLPRHYAVIEVDGRGLAELLVENGLARLHGMSVTHPDGRSASDYIASLAVLENVARDKRIGAWAQSRPELQHPTVEEIPEPSQMPRWLERLLFTATGAAAVVAVWVFTAVVRKRREATARQQG
jgi:endonuclease YncB( thermonuclease family)